MFIPFSLLPRNICFGMDKDREAVIDTSTSLSNVRYVGFLLVVRILGLVANGPDYPDTVLRSCLRFPVDVKCPVLNINL